MDLGLTDAQKLMALNSVKNGIQTDIYTQLIRMGFDPDTYEPSADNDVIDSFVGERTRVNTLISSLELIESKITELS
jgi:hypothetical protein